MHVKTRAALIVERLGHEGGEQAAAAGDLLHGRLEPERAVGGVGQLRVAEVDLELARRELVVGRRHLQAGVAQLPEHVQQQALRVALAADHVDVAQLVGVPLPAPVGVPLAEEELQLGAADQAVPEAGDLIGRPGARTDPRRLRRRRAVRGDRVAQAPGGVRLPRQRRQRRQVGADVDVRQPRLEAALRPATTSPIGEVWYTARQNARPCPAAARQLVEQHVTAAVHPDQVRIRHPDHVDAARRATARTRPRRRSPAGSALRLHGQNVWIQMIWNRSRGRPGPGNIQMSPGMGAPGT